jgi:hypothetical protein
MTLRIVLKHSSLVSSNDVIEKAWIGMTFLDEVLTGCYVLLLLICQTACHRLCPGLPKESDISSPG